MTVTDQQIRDLLSQLLLESSKLDGDEWLENRNQAHECRVALGITRSGYKGGKSSARTRCTEILKDRAAKGTTP